MPKKRIRKKYRYRAGGEVNGSPPIPFDVASALSNEEIVQKKIIRDLKRDDVKSADEFALAGGLGSLGSKNRVPDGDRAGRQEMEPLTGVPPFIGGPLRTGAKLLGSQIIKNPRVARLLGGRGYDPRISQFRNLMTGRFRGDEEMGRKAAGRIAKTMAPLGIGPILKNIFRDKEKETIVSRRSLNGRERSPLGPIDFERAAGQSVRPERIDLSDIELEEIVDSLGLGDRTSRPSAGFLRPPSSYRGPNVPWAERDTGREKPRMRRASGGIIGLQAGGWGGAGGGGGWGAGGGGGGMGGGQGFVANNPQGPGFGQAPDYGPPGSQPWGGGGGMGGPPGGGAGAPPGGGWGAPPGGAPPAGGPPAGAPPAGGPGYQPQGMPANYGAPQQYAGYGGPQTMDVTQQFVSPEVAQQYADLTQGIMQAGTRPYEQYQGPQLAGFTGMEAAAQAGLGAYGTGQGPQATRQAEATLGEAAGGFGQIAAGAAKPQLEREADLSQYMSQYTKGVVDPQLRQLQEFQKEQAQELGSQAAGAGAFGGYRQAIQQGQQAQAASQQAADIIGKGQQQAFQSAQQAFERDRAAKQAGVGQQISAYGQMAGIGGRQAQLGGQQQQQQMDRLQQMQRAGASQRQLQQASLDIRKQQWEQERQYPERQISWMGQQLAGLPYQNIVQSGTYTPQMGPVASALGAGVAGLSAWDQWKARQPTSPYAKPPPIATPEIELPDTSIPETPTGITPGFAPPPGYITTRPGSGPGYGEAQPSPYDRDVGPTVPIMQTPDIGPIRQPTIPEWQPDPYRRGTAMPARRGYRGG